MNDSRSRISVDGRVAAIVAIILLIVGTILAIFGSLYFNKVEGHERAAVTAKLLITEGAGIIGSCMGTERQVDLSPDGALELPSIPTGAWEAAAAQSDFVADLSDTDRTQLQQAYQQAEFLKGLEPFYTSVASQLALSNRSRLLASLNREIEARCASARLAMIASSRMLEAERAAEQRRYDTESTALQVISVLAILSLGFLAVLLGRMR